MAQTVSIVKIGGAFLETPGRAASFTKAFAGMPGPKVLIHGGGQRATQLSTRLGIEPRMVDGRRITDGPSLEVAVMVYGGWANKTLVARLQALGCPALGVSGADADLIRAVKRPVGAVDYGFVGDVERVNLPALKTLLGAGLVPVFCALTHAGKGQLLNTNADTIAAELAIALGAEYESHLYYCFEKEGVLGDVNDPTSVIPKIDPGLYETLREGGKIAAGMLPKLHNCFQSLERGVARVFIGSTALLSPQCETYTEVTL